MPEHIFLSAHLDDAVYSCGGLIHQQVRAGGSCTVLTVFAGDPPPGSVSVFAEQLHQRWGLLQAPVAARRAEDLAACGRLGAAAIHFGLPEAIYRRQGSGTFIYPDEQAIFGPVQSDDRKLIDAIADALGEVGLSGSRIYAPLALGAHVDHIILRTAAEALGAPLWYYSDLPYAMRGGAPDRSAKPPHGVEAIRPLEAEDLTAWVDAAACYRSQISTFWDDADALQVEFAAYLAREGGIHILAPAAAG